MTNKRIRRVTARDGYDYWADTYDRTPNPVVTMDSRHTLSFLGPRRGEWILDAGCGTGRHLEDLLVAGCRPVGIDFSEQMLKIARKKNRRPPLALADLGKPLPLAAERFDAVLCALVGEHVEDLDLLFREFFFLLKPSGRMVFSVYHPSMAAAGIEANFDRGEVEFRLGAHRHTVADYARNFEEAGFSGMEQKEFFGDETLATAIPAAEKFIGLPILLLLRGRKDPGAET